MWVYICRPIGDVAQLVEQWIENPCVGGSIPSITTRKPFGTPRGFFYASKLHFKILRRYQWEPKWAPHKIGYQFSVNNSERAPSQPTSNDRTL